MPFEELTFALALFAAAAEEEVAAILEVAGLEAALMEL